MLFKKYLTELFPEHNIAFCPSGAKLPTSPSHIYIDETFIQDDNCSSWWWARIYICDFIVHKIKYPHISRKNCSVEKSLDKDIFEGVCLLNGF